MKINTCLHMFVVVCLFCLTGCSSSDPTGNAGAGSSGSNIGPHGDKPSAVQRQSCTDAKPYSCAKYTYNSHGDVEKYEECPDNGCQQWCDQPIIECTAYEYDDKGRVIVSRPSDCKTPSANYCTKFGYEGDGKNWVSKADCNGNLTLCRVLTYTAQGQIETSHEVDCQTKEGIRCDRYAYDQQGRLIETTYGPTCDRQEQMACIRMVYEGEVVKASGFTDGNCENITMTICNAYYY